MSKFSEHQLNAIPKAVEAESQSRALSLGSWAKKLECHAITIRKPFRFDYPPIPTVLTIGSCEDRLSLTCAHVSS